MNKALIIFFLFFYTVLQSQNTRNPWLVGMKTNYMDFFAPDRNLKNLFTKADWMGTNLPSSILIGYQINNSIVVSGLFSYTQLEVEKLNFLPLRDTLFKSESTRFTIEVEYKFANDYFLSKNSWFDPYVSFGAGVTFINDEPEFTQTSIIGSNLWVLGNLGFRFEASYNYLPEFNNYLNYSFGLIARFGKADSDRDGIANRKDKCPKIPGLESFSGCPDYDKDGIPDHLDRCPRDNGIPANNGCPDLDMDGTMDPYDRCPEIVGVAEFNGCPDTDHDGVPDIDDACSSVFGSIVNQGCPESKEIVQPKKDDEETIEESPNQVTKDSTMAAKIKSSTDLFVNTDNNVGHSSKIKSSTPKKYLLVAGSFKNIENANKLLNNYKEKGYNSRITDILANGFFTVIIESFDNLNSALTTLHSIKSSLNPDAWILPVY